MSRRGAVVISGLALAACHHEVPVEHLGSGARIEIRVESAGATAEEVERRVVMPLALPLLGLPRVRHVRARATADGVARIEVELAPGTDAFGGLEVVQQQLESASAELPVGATPPMVSVEPGPAVLRFVVSGRLTAAELRELADWTIEPALLQVAGVAGVETCGGAEREWQVAVDPGRLSAVGLTVTEVARAVSDANTALPGGAVQQQGLTLRVAGGSLDPAQLGQLVVTERGGAPVRVGDVADVRETGKPSPCQALADGRPVVAGTVLRRGDGDSAAVRQAVEKALGRLRATLPSGITVEILPRTRPIAIAVDGEAPPQLAAISGALARIPAVAHVLVEAGAEASAPGITPGRARVHVVPVPDADADTVEARALAGLRASGLAVHDRRELIVQVRGADLGQLAALAQHIGEALTARHLIVNGTPAGARQQPELKIELDRARLAQLAVSERDVANLLLAATGPGLELATSYAGARAVPIVLVVPGHDDPAALRELEVPGMSGTPVPLASVVKISRGPQPAEIDREDGERWVGVAVSGSAEAVRAAAASVAMPAGYHWQLVAGGP